MSVKSFIPAESYLNSFGVTVKQAQEFIDLNIEQPEIIFEVAFEYGVTTAMLSEIKGYPRDIVREYFNTIDTDGRSLDGRSILVNSDLGSLEPLVNFNSKTGFLSNVALRDGVQQQLQNDGIQQNLPFPAFYDPTFSPNRRDIQKNGTYDAEELGVGSLGNVPATSESLESLFYGSLINMFSALDESEWSQITTLRANGSAEDYHALLLTSLSTSPSSIAWSDETMAQMVQKEASYIIEEYWTSEAELIGILDYSFLGLATA